MHQEWNKAWIDLRKGDRKGLSNLYELSIDVLYDYGTRVTEDSNLVEDAVQDLFLKLWNKRTQLPEVSSVKAYLYTSLRNTLLKKLERHYNKQHHSDEEINSNETSKSIDEVWSENEEKEFRQENLIRAIQQLPKKQQEIVYLVYSCGFSYAEIEDILSVKNQSLRNTMSRAIKNLKVLMNKSELKIVLFLSTLPFLKDLSSKGYLVLETLWKQI